MFLKNKDKSKYWILKPVDSARGEGIKIISSTRIGNRQS